jgi:hypothetical protein
MTWNPQCYILDSSMMQKHTEAFSTYARAMSPVIVFLEMSNYAREVFEDTTLAECGSV